MNLNLLLTTPLSYTFSRSQPTDAQGNLIPYTIAEQAMADGIASISGEWLEVGRTATHKLFRVVTQGSDLASIEGLIKATGTPLTVIHAQDAHESPVLDAQGMPVMDAAGNPTYQVVVHKQATKATLLPFMPDAVTYSSAMPPVELSRKKATTVTLPVWGGHAAWQI